MTICAHCQKPLDEYELEEQVCFSCGYNAEEEDEFDPADLNEDDQYFENQRELDQKDEDLL